MLVVNQLSFEYKREELVLKDINFELKEGKIYSLLGKNGAGKTTLLKCIHGVYDINSGDIVKKEEPIFIGDSPQLYYYLTGKEYIELILTLNNHENKDLAFQLVDELEMKEHLNKNIIDYSFGMKHKLALISSIILNYQLYLIDEPLTALDPETSRFMINYFKKMRDTGKTLLIATHMMHIAYELSDEILILHHGKISSVKNDFKTYDDFENYCLHQLKIPLEA